MIVQAEKRGTIKPGDTLIEATSGNTGIALAMVAAMRGYKMVLIMPENQSLERRQAMKAYGAELILVSKEKGIEGARDLAVEMQQQGKVWCWTSSPTPTIRRALHRHRPRDLAADRRQITHFVSAMGTTGTITGISNYLKEQNENIVIVGAQPTDGSSIAGIRKWPEAYRPAIFKQARVDRVEEVSQADAEEMAPAWRWKKASSAASASRRAAIALRLAGRGERDFVFVVLIAVTVTCLRACFRVRHQPSAASAPGPDFAGGLGPVAQMYEVGESGPTEGRGKPLLQCSYAPNACLRHQNPFRISRNTSSA